MTDIIMWVGIAGIGFIIGILFFGGLWWTVRKGMTSPHPVLWFIGSLGVRMGVTVGGFYVVSQGQWQRLMVCFAGFIVARLVVTLATRQQVESESIAHPAVAVEPGHAS